MPNETSNPPQVSVVIPTRDRPEMLAEAIRTVRAQTFTDYEIVVVVNGPDTDLTRRSLAVAEAGGCRTVRIERSGIAVALNAGAAAARGEWIAFLDDDDLWEPNKIEIELKTAATEAADVVFSDFFIIDGDRREAAPRLRPPPSLTVKEAMTLRNYGGGCSSTTVRRAAMLAVGGFDEAMRSPDWDLWLRLSWRFRLTWTGAYLVYVRHHPQNTSKQISWAYWTLSIQAKALRNLPRDLRHLRPRILAQMARVAMKGAETYIRHHYLLPLRRKIRGGA